MSELQRRLVHASGTLVPVLYLLGVATWTHVTVVLVGGALVALVLEALRLGGLLEWWVYDRLTREYEHDNLAGYAIYFVSSAVTAVAFDPQVAVPAILMLTVGDPISGLLSAGDLSKRGPVLAAMFAVCLTLALPFVPLPVAAAGAAVAAVADGVKPVVWTYVVDDNLTIPLGAATAMWAGLLVLG